MSKFQQIFCCSCISTDKNNIFLFNEVQGMTFDSIIGNIPSNDPTTLEQNVNRCTLCNISRSCTVCKHTMNFFIEKKVRRYLSRNTVHIFDESNFSPVNSLNAWKKVE